MYNNERVIGWEFFIFLVQQFPVLRSRSLQNHVLEIFFTETFPYANICTEAFEISVDESPGLTHKNDGEVVMPCFGEYSSQRRLFLLNQWMPSEVI
jgi:hypothetical protein